MFTSKSKKTRYTDTPPAALSTRNFSQASSQEHQQTNLQIGSRLQERLLVLFKRNEVGYASDRMQFLNSPACKSLFLHPSIHHNINDPASNNSSTIIPGKINNISFSIKPAAGKIMMMETTAESVHASRRTSILTPNLPPQVPEPIEFPPFVQSNHYEHNASLYERVADFGKQSTEDTDILASAPLSPTQIHSFHQTSATNTTINIEEIERQVKEAEMAELSVKAEELKAKMRANQLTHSSLYLHSNEAFIDLRPASFVLEEEMHQKQVSFTQTKYNFSHSSSSHSLTNEQEEVPSSFEETLIKEPSSFHTPEYATSQLNSQIKKVDDNHTPSPISIEDALVGKPSSFKIPEYAPLQNEANDVLKSSNQLPFDEMPVGKRTSFNIPEYSPEQSTFINQHSFNEPSSTIKEAEPEVITPQITQIIIQSLSSKSPTISFSKSSSFTLSQQSLNTENTASSQSVKISRETLTASNEFLQDLFSALTIGDNKQLNRNDLEIKGTEGCRSQDGNVESPHLIPSDDFPTKSQINTLQEDYNFAMPVGLNAGHRGSRSMPTSPTTNSLGPMLSPRTIRGERIKELVGRFEPFLQQ